MIPRVILTALAWLAHAIVTITPNVIKILKTLIDTRLILFARCAIIITNIKKLLRRKVNDHAMPIVYCVMTTSNALINPSLGEIYKMLYRTGTNVNNGMTALLIINHFGGTKKAGLNFTGTTFNRNVPNKIDKQIYNNAWLILTKISIFYYFFLFKTNAKLAINTVAAIANTIKINEFDSS